jgi:hypothetical protein
MRWLFLTTLVACVWTPQRGCSEVGGVNISRSESGISGSTSFTTSPSQSCEVQVSRSVPADGATDQYYRDPIVFHLRSSTGEEIIESSISGQTLVLDDGKELDFVPDAPLDPSTAYLVSIYACESFYDLHFSTSSYGAPLLVPLSGTAWSLDLSSASTTDFFSSTLSSQLQPLLLAAGTTLRVAPETSAGAQDWCAATSETSLPPDDLPYFSVHYDRIELETTAPFPLQDVTLSGTIAPDATAVRAELSGQVDLRTLDLPSLGYSDPQEACTELSAKGQSCAACDDGQAVCLAVSFPALPGTAWTEGLPAVPGDHCTACEQGPPSADATCDTPG